MGPDKRVIECKEGFLEEAIWSGRSVQDEDEVAKLRRVGGLPWESRGWHYVPQCRGHVLNPARRTDAWLVQSKIEIKQQLKKKCREDMQVEGTACVKTWMKKDHGRKLQATWELSWIGFPDHLHKLSITIEKVLWILLFPSARESYVYAILYSLKVIIFKQQQSRNTQYRYGL